MTAPPITFAWDGEALAPATPFMARLADKHLVIGETYSMAEQKERSKKSHDHFFASVAEAWSNLPEHLAEEYANPEALRKKALIRTGHADEQSIVCSSKAEALRFAAFIRPIDDYSIVTVKEAVVTRYTAKSQSKKAMGAADFQASKEAVFAYIDKLLGVESGAVAANAGRAA